MAKVSAKMAKKLAAARINRAVVGFQIPMMSIPKLYKVLEDAIADDKSDDELKAAVAVFSGVVAA